MEKTAEQKTWDLIKDLFRQTKEMNQRAEELNDRLDSLDEKCSMLQQINAGLFKHNQILKAENKRLKEIVSESSKEIIHGELKFSDIVKEWK